VPVPCCWCCYGRYCDTSSITLFAQYYLSYSCLLSFHLNFRIDFSVVIIGAFSWSLPLLRIDMVGWMAVGGILYQTGFGVSTQDA
jgi:hypothetical protein